MPHMNEKMNTPAASTAEQQTEELQLTAKKQLGATSMD